MKITEIFQSVQGEGPFTGQRSIFIRMFGCNLKCPFCDSTYSWKPGNVYLDLDNIQIMKAVNQMDDISHVVITGGEPTIQMTELRALVDDLKKHGLIVTIETNGTNLLDPSFADVIMVSPKDLPTADNWIELFQDYDNVYLKFVVNQSNVFNVLKWAKDNHLTGLILMPQGVTPAEVITGSLKVLDLLMEHHADHIICPRTHILLGLR